MKYYKVAVIPDDQHTHSAWVNIYKMDGFYNVGLIMFDSRERAMTRRNDGIDDADMEGAICVDTIQIFFND